MARVEDKVYRERHQDNQNTRVLLSTRKLILSVLSRGSVTVAILIWEKFYSWSFEVDPNLLERISKEEYRLQYREFVRTVEKIARDPSLKEQSDMELLELITS